MCQTYGRNSSTCNCDMPPPKKIGDLWEYPILTMENYYNGYTWVFSERWEYPSDNKFLGLKSADKALTK